MPDFWWYLAVSVGVTYLIRMLPLVLVKRRIQNPFILSFLYYIPYTVLSVMTIPSLFLATEHLLSAVVGFAVAMVLACCKKSLLTVALAMAASVCCMEWLLR